MGIRILFALLSVFLMTAVQAQKTKKPLGIEDLMNLKSVADPQISPDGSWIAFTVSENDLQKDKAETRIWMVSTRGGDPIPMTAKGYSASEPRWSPDNKYLSFLAAKTEEEKTQVWTLNRLGGEAQQLTNIKQGVSGHAWSPDGQRLLLSIKDPRPEELTDDKEDDKKAKPVVVDRLQFKKDEEGYLDRHRTHLYLFMPGDTAAVQITSGDFDDTDPVWSPDGKSVAFVSNRTQNPDGNNNTDIWIVAADNTDKGRTLRQVTHNPNEDESPAWSPDGKSLAFITVTDGKAMWYATHKLAIAPAAGGQPSILTDNLDRNVSKPRFSADGKSVFFILEENGASVLASAGISGMPLARVVEGEVSVQDYALNGTAVVPLLSRFAQPAEIFIRENERLTQLTFFNKPVLDPLQPASIEKIRFHSADGTAVEGFVVRPPGFDPSMKYPAVLWLHGGPVDQFEYGYETGYSDVPLLLAANGYVAIQVNPRGSSGYGQAFSQAIFADWGARDFQDAMAAVDHVIGQGYVDPDRLGVGGWSYGGILTNYIITQTGRFKAAMSGASEALYRTNYGHDHYQLAWEQELGLPWENAAGWERISPFNRVTNITTPTLWMGGSADWNVPVINSEQMYQAMKRLGKETQLVVYPDEHHEFARPSFIKDRFERYLLWFDKYVKG